MDKSPDAFRTISEVGEDMDLPQHVLRFWETRFPQIKPLKRGGGRRYYRPDDVALLRAIKQLLYGQGYTIKGVQKLLKEQGVASVALRFAAEGEAESAQVEAPTPRVTTRAEPAAAPSSGAKTKPVESGDLAVLRSALADLREAERLLAAARST
ncbi:MAG: MerR family transcriptional regulator [Bradyrhizobium sp.]|nr:MAG: MerR family transcriptional regulator [Bradyrhizobium sp.]